MVKPISPYLLRPLRSLDEAMRELEAQAEQERQARAQTEAGKQAADGGPKSTPRDTVTIAGKDVPVTPGEPTPPSTGGQLDVKA